MPDYPRLQPRSRRAWRAWLQRNHHRSTGVWLVYAKKHTNIPSLSYNDAVEEALCFGWIDSKINPIDDRLYMQVFTPRKPKSAWSALNKERVARLLGAGQMTAAGLALITLAKKTGTWNELDHVDTLTTPQELGRAIEASAAARRAWDALRPTQKKQLLYHLWNAKKAETRARRVEEIVGMLETGWPRRS